MNKVIFYFFILQSNCQFAFSQDTTISKEQFINEIEDSFIDSGSSKFYLYDEARPCSFQKFDYGQLVKYSLKKMVPIFVLNELSKNTHEDTTTDDTWISEKLDKAICINSEKKDSFLNPAARIWDDQTLTQKKKKKAAERMAKEWTKKPVNETSFFNFSKPVFTDDHQYAVMNVTFQTVDYSNASTFIFQRNDDGWEIVGTIPGWDKVSN